MRMRGKINVREIQISLHIHKVNGLSHGFYVNTTGAIGPDYALVAIFRTSFHFAFIRSTFAILADFFSEFYSILRFSVDAYASCSEEKKRDSNNPSFVAILCDTKYPQSHIHISSEQ